jgi:TRAP-type transport system small permease protein
MGKHFDEFLENFVCFIYTTLIAVSFLQVFSRYVLNYSLPWTEEIGRYSFVYLTFIGAALCVRDELNINLDLMIKRLPRSWSAARELMVDLAVMAFLMLLLYQGYLISLKTSRQVSAALHIPMVIFYLSIPLGAVFMFVSMARVFLKHKRHFKNL